MKTTPARLVLALCAAAFAAPAQPQTYPTKPIRIIVPYASGGSTDVLFRIFAPKVAEVLGQQAVIDNRPGAASTIGLDMVAKSPPDGLVSIVTMLLSVHPSVPAKSV